MVNQPNYGDSCEFSMLAGRRQHRAGETETQGRCPPRSGEVRPRDSARLAAKNTSPVKKSLQLSRKRCQWHLTTARDSGVFRPDKKSFSLADLND